MAKPETLPHVFTFREWCESAGLSKQTAKRLIAAGQGPKLTRLSPRRIGVRSDHAMQWLNERMIKSFQQDKRNGKAQ